MDDRVVFNLLYAEDEFIKKCLLDDLKAFLSLQKKMSQITWSESYKTQRKGLGGEPIEQTAICVSLPRIITKDVTLLSFRMSERGRVIGFRNVNYFMVIWIDAKHEVYKG